MTAPFHNLQASFRHCCIKSVIIATFLGFSVLVFLLSWQDILMRYCSSLGRHKPARLSSWHALMRFMFLLQATGLGLILKGTEALRRYGDVSYRLDRLFMQDIRGEATSLHNFRPTTVGPASSLRIYASSLNQSLNVALCQGNEAARKPHRLAEEEIRLSDTGPSPRKPLLQYPSLDSKVPSSYFPNHA